MSENAKNITIKGLFWNAIDRFGYQVITNLTTIVLARIFAPDDFGVIYVLAIFTTIATSLVDSGLATSLVRSKVVKDVDYSTMFVFNLLVSGGIYLILFIAAPYLEELYQINNLILYARVLFLQILVQAFGIVQYVKMLKSFQFNLTARVNFIAVLGSAIVVVFLAWIGLGFWGLLLQAVLYAFFRSVLLWVWGNWKLDLSFSKESMRTHWGFSISFMISNLLGKLLSPLYNNLLKMNYTTEDVGIYGMANKLGESPNLLISSVVQGTTLSTLTPLQDDFPRFLNACRKTMSSLAFLLFPVSFLAICVAEPAFQTLLKEKWNDAIPLFQWLCFAGLFISLTDMNVNFLNIKGKSKFALVLEVIKVGSAVGIFFFTYQHGLLAVVFGQLAIRILCYIIAASMSVKVYGYTIFAQAKDLFSSFLISLLAAVIAYLPLYFGWISNNLYLLVAQTLIFALIYIGINHMIKNQIWMEVLDLAKKKISKKV